MRCPVFIDESAYGQLIDYPTHPGWNKTTHLAMVDLGQGEEPVYVKLIFTPYFPALANEAIGWMLAHACGIPAPERTAVMVAPAAYWRTWLGALPADAPTEGDICAWCCARCGDKDQETWLSLSEDLAALSLFKSKIGLKIAAFDTWLHNPDRNPRNLVRLSRGEWAVIDHELLFNGPLGSWRKPKHKRDLSATPYLLARLNALRAAGRIKTATEARYRSGMIDSASRHIDAIARVLPYLADILDRIEPPDTARASLPVLVDRAWPFWMPATLNTLL